VDIVKHYVWLSHPSQHRQKVNWVPYYSTHIICQGEWRNKATSSDREWLALECVELIWNKVTTPKSSDAAYNPGREFCQYMARGSKALQEKEKQGKLISGASQYSVHNHAEETWNDRMVLGHDILISPKYIINLRRKGCDDQNVWVSHRGRVTEANIWNI
jgi:hypothetical protein